MRRRDFLFGAGTTGILTATGLPKFAAGADAPARSFYVAVDDDAPPLIRETAQSIADAQGHPLLDVLRKNARGQLISSRQLLSAPLADRAFSHLVLVGLPTDPLIATVWQREARATRNSFYIFGFGHLKGDIGYIESDRNLFLHSPGITSAPFETEIVTISGTTPAGLQLARDAFLSRHLINGVVAANGWSRAEPGLLDRDPLASDFTLPEQALPSVNQYLRIGFTQASEDEYRGLLADTGLMAKMIWRAKYHTQGVWDHPGALAAFDAYSFGLHRRAYGNTRWIAAFNSEDDAAHAVPKIAAAAHLERNGDRWVGLQPYYAYEGTAGDNRGPLALWRESAFVLMSTVPDD